MSLTPRIQTFLHALDQSMSHSFSFGGNDGFQIVASFLIALHATVILHFRSFSEDESHHLRYLIFTYELSYLSYY